MFAMDFVPGDI